MPEERLAASWESVGDALEPGGHVVFVDDADRAPGELVYGADSPVIMRRRPNADGFRIVKMPIPRPDCGPGWRNWAGALPCATTDRSFAVRGRAGADPKC